MLNGTPRLHPAEQPLDHLRRALRSSQVAELDPRNLASGRDDVEPDHLAGLEVDQRGIIELLLSPDIGRAKADETAGQPEQAERDPPLRRDRVLGMKKQSI